MTFQPGSRENPKFPLPEGPLRVAVPMIGAQLRLRIGIDRILALDRGKKSKLTATAVLSSPIDWIESPPSLSKILRLWSWIWALLLLTIPLSEEQVWTVVPRVPINSAMNFSTPETPYLVDPRA